MRCSHLLHLSSSLLLLFGSVVKGQEADWKALGIVREPLPSESNPIVALEKLFEEFPDWARQEFIKNNDPPPEFYKFVPGNKTLRVCKDLQARARRIVAHGPGQIPRKKNEAIPLPGSYVIMDRFNSALAADAYNKGNFAEAADHFFFTIEFAGFIALSEPTLTEFLLAQGDKASAMENLILIYEASGDRTILDRLARAAQKHRFGVDHLLSAIRTEAYDSYRILQDYRKALREAEKAVKGFEELTQLIKEEMFHEPLRSCPSEQLLAMKFDRAASLQHDLRLWKMIMAWARTEKPLSSYPLRKKKTTPRKLKYYQSAPNGLYEIHIDCSKSDPLFNAVMSVRSREIFLLTSLAWIRAEADGITIDSLASLVPGYLDTIPSDPSDGKPLRCLPGKRIIYSIGTDFKDEKGRSAEADQRFYGIGPAEPAYRIPHLKTVDPDPFAD